MSKFTHFYPWQLASRAAGVQLTCKIMDNIPMDIDALRSEVGRILSEYAPAKHSRGDHHDGGWTALGLISHDGNPFEDRKILPYRKTPALSLAPNLEKLIDRFETEKGRVRLMQLQPAKSILWHYDRQQTVDGDEYARLHIPIITNDRVRTQISHEDVVWKAGEIWYGDFSFPHRLYNAGQESRVHLVLDLELNDFVLSAFPDKFLAQRDKRLRVKKACQRMFDYYELGRFPPRTSLRKFRKLVAST